VTINTTAVSAAGLTQPGHNAGPLFALWSPIPGIALLGAGLASDRKRRKRVLQLLAGCVVLIGLAALVGCGGGSSTTTTGGGNPGTPAGTYTITVNGTAAGVTTQSATITLTVK
jgi:hypothetical protein